ncbi:MAG: zinc-ribbon and DUF3426 domain-containing protein [Gammaproteobacteria bacterium]|jgi:predicted Zn finger-like uncharacterized protein|nr:zinc-ribbon and DUF3426 domain-containing protein [Gammaproteobacteria bacterium]
MFTECPECQTVFRLTAGDLRRAQGKVRCGDCHAVFNALESLAEEPAAPPPPASAAATSRTPQPSWLIDSANNPPGDLDPDLDAYEKTAYLPEGEVAFDYEFDDDEDDDGAILYIEDEQRTASNADTLAAPAAPEADADTAELSWTPDATGPGWQPDADEQVWAIDEDLNEDLDEDLNARLEDDDFDDDLDTALSTDLSETADDDFDTALPDFDETIWERIPGVAAAAPPAADAAGPFAVGPAADAVDALDAPDAPDAMDEDGAAGERLPDPPRDVAAEQASALEVWVTEGGSTLEPAAAAATGAPAGPAAGDAAEAEAEVEAFHPAGDPPDQAAPGAAEDALEFDVPAENWNQFFGPVAATPRPVAWEPPPQPGDEATAAAADTAAPSWQADEPADTERGSSGTWLRLTGGLLLAVLFAGQLLHYNRDELAAHPEYGAWVRDLYGALNQTLYPAWPLLNNYEIRGSEAVVGESGQDVMDIRAQIAAVGKHTTGLPRLRVVLRDRWSNPVAASDFGPEQYATAADLPADGLLRPGAVVPARVSIADPGAGVQGFELELCLPRRNTGLECTDQPFK